MLYYELETGSNVYKLRLNTRNVVSLESKIGCNPLMIFGDGDKVPEVSTMVQILHCSLQTYEHGITLDKAYTIFDEWIADGHVMTDFISIILEIYKVSGLIGEEENEKN